MERKTGLCSSAARRKASSPHGYQSTGLWACCCRYGLLSRARWFGGFCFRGGSDDKAALHPDLSADMSEELMSLSEVPIRHETYEGVQVTFINARDIMGISGFLFIFNTGIIVIALSYALDRLWAGAMPVRAIYLFIRFPGVVLHECSHIIGCFLTGARIHKVVLFSENGGSVTYSGPRLPYIGDVIISTAPLFLLPLALSFVTWAFGSYLGCVFPAFPPLLESADAISSLGLAVFGTFSKNLLVQFNGWFLLYLYLTVSLVLSVAPGTQDMKNAAAGSILLVLAGALIAGSGIPRAISLLDELVRLLGYGFTLGAVYGFVALFVSLPLLFWYAYKHHS
jgi:hypothetical protein